MQLRRRSGTWIGKEGENRESKTRVAQHGRTRNDIRQWGKNWRKCWTTKSTITRTCFAYHEHSTMRTTANTFLIADSVALTTGRHAWEALPNRPRRPMILKP